MHSEYDQERRVFLKTAAAATAVAAAPAVAKPVIPARGEPDWDGMAWAEHIRKGDVTPKEALEAAISRTEALPKLNAVVIQDYEMARAKAKAMSALGREARAQATAQAPMWGVPFLIKDLNQYVKGSVTTNGCRFYAGAVADYDSTLVERYKAAGLNIFGKTASPEFGQTATTESTLFGATPNPWNPRHSAGGSSGGAGAVVAAGILPVAHASDGGGSIRIPAAHCGLVGLKPSRGRVPTGPINMEGWMGLSLNHVVCRTVRDSAHLLDLTAGPEAGSRVMPPKDVSGTYLQALQQPERKLRIAVWRQNYFGIPVHPDCVAAQDHAAKTCAALGHIVEEVALPGLDVLALFTSLGVMTSVGMRYTIAQREKLLGRKVREDELEPLNWRYMQVSEGYTAEQLYAARAQFDQAGRVIDQFLHDYDLILTPTTGEPAPLLGKLALTQSYEDFARQAMKTSVYTALFNMSGHPAISLPMHWTADNVPVGAQFVAPFGGEGRLLRLAAQLEQAVPWAQRRPDLSVFQA